MIIFNRYSIALSLMLVCSTSLFADEVSPFLNESDELEEEATTKETLWESISFRGVGGVVYNSYSTDKTSDTVAVEGNINAKKSFDWGKIVTNIAFLYDFDDERRRYIILNELYFKYQFQDSFFQLGRSIRNWGVLEGYGISDVFNTKNYLSDSFDTSSKYGALNAEYTLLVNDSVFSLIVKGEEVEQPYPAEDNIYNFYHYDSQLNTEKSQYFPTVYLKYSDVYSGDEVQADYSLILQHGYDNKRDITDLADGTVVQEAYLVNKVIAYAALTYESFIYKFETEYTQVLNYTPMSDYMHMGIGTEYIPSASIKGAELRIITEYYRYHYFDESKKKIVDISEIYQNDLFFGIQSTFGDAGTSEIKAGIAVDLENNEQVYGLNFETRMKQNYRLSMEWKVFVPGDDPTTAIGQMEQFNQVTFRANYFF